VLVIVFGEVENGEFIDNNNNDNEVNNNNNKIKDCNFNGANINNKKSKINSYDYYNNDNENNNYNNKSGNNDNNFRIEVVNIPPTEVVFPELMHINNPTSAPEFCTDVTDIVDVFSPSLLFLLLHFLLSLHVPPSAPSFPLPPFPSTSMAFYLSPYLPPPLLYPLAF
jgi:hypothetical protein